MRRLIEALAVTVFLAFVLFLIYYKFNFASYHLPTASMSPTIMEGSYVWGSRVKLDRISRYDIVAYKYEDIMYLSRVIGLPGDRISFDENSRLLLNGQLHGKNKRELSEEMQINIPFHDSVLYAEDISYKDKKFSIAYSNEQFKLYGNHLSNKTLTVGKNKVYLVSDYRSNAMDSRVYGELPMDSIKFKITHLLFPKPIDFSNLITKLN